MKIKKINLSDKVILEVAEDISSHFTIPKYELFLIKHDLLSYNSNDYSYLNKIDFIRNTLGEIDERLFLELDNKNVLSDKAKDALIEEGVVFRNSADMYRDSVVKIPESQSIPVQNSPKKENIQRKEENTVRNKKNKSDKSFLETTPGSILP